MKPDDLERLARIAGFVGVADDEDASVLSPPTRPPLSQRLKTPDAPAPRAASTILAVAGPVTTVARVAVTSYVSGAIRSAQGLLSTRGATA